MITIIIIIIVFQIYTKTSAQSITQLTYKDLLEPGQLEAKVPPWQKKTWQTLVFGQPSVLMIPETSHK